MEIMEQTQENENKNVEKKQLKPLQFSDKSTALQKRLFEEIKKLGHEKELLQNKIKILETTPPKNELVEVIHQLTREIESKEEKIFNHEKIMVARDKQDRLLKQTIKDINKRYSEAEEMYEQVSVNMEKCMKDNENLKQDLIEKKNIVVTKYKFLGFCFLTKTSD